MTAQETVSRRFFSEAIASAALGFGIKALLGSEEAEASEGSTKILTNPLDLKVLTDFDRGLIERLNNLSEEKVPLWTFDDTPSWLFSQKIGICETFQKIRGVKNSLGIFEYDTPDSGIATPENPLYPLVFGYGHYSWRGVKQTMSRIIWLSMGDVITVLNGKHTIPYCFVVSGLRLSNEDVVRRPLLLGLSLQTSATENGIWLPDKNDTNEIFRKFDTSSFDGVNGNIYVDAKPVRIRVPA